MRNLKALWLAALALGMPVCAIAQTPVCDVNSAHLPLSCEAALVTGTYGVTHTSNLQAINPTLASQLSQLPIATAISGSGILISNLFSTSPTTSLGTILTQRGETIGKNKMYISFGYQRFTFDKLDGTSLRGLQTLQQTNGAQSFVNDDMALRIDQYTAIATFGIAPRVDVSVILPFSNVSFNNSARIYNCPSTTCSDVPGDPNTFRLGNRNRLVANGTAGGIGDVIANTKWNFFKSQSERTNMAVGLDVRFPTGDEANLLGTGAYGFKPYIVLSHTQSRFTPNVNAGYQWNGNSSLIRDSQGHLDSLPNSFFYSAGLDVRVVKRLTVNAEFLGQAVINGYQTVSTMEQLTLFDFYGNAHTSSYKTIRSTIRNTYTMDNVAVGFKCTPIRKLPKLNLSASAMFALDDAGLRTKIVPYFGISYVLTNPLHK
jgi:Putative MetA-pathway of phenol degradation